MRSITFKGQEVKYDFAAKLSENYDEKHFTDDTEYIKINCAVLGNATGIETVDGTDLSTALAAVHGRKYNNASISIPFERTFVTKHYAEIDKLVQEIAKKTSGMCATIQRMMKPSEIQEGREMAMRSQAIRDAKKEIQNAGTVLDSAMFNKANASVRGQSKSKVYVTYGVGVSARRVQDTQGLAEKGQFNRKNITSNNGQSIQAYTTTADEAGLKKVPIMTTEMREKAEQMVYDTAVAISMAINKIVDDPNGDACLLALKDICASIPGDPNLQVDIPPYTEAELDQIRTWKEDIIRDYYKA